MGRHGQLVPVCCEADPHLVQEVQEARGGGRVDKEDRGECQEVGEAFKPQVDNNSYIM